jgi:hypothetical protein
MYNTPQHTSKYCCSYCFGERNTCLEGGFPPFPSPHPMTNGYPYHQVWLSNFYGCYHCWPDLNKYGATNINDNNTFNDDDDGCLERNTILCQWALGDDFIPFVIETYGCFHYRFDSFLTTCAHTIITCH